MKESFIDWKPKQLSRQRLAVIGDVLTQYDGMGLKLTLRQLFYQLVSKNIIPNSQKEYKRLGELLSKARLAGLVDWEIIEDRVRRPIRASEWDSISELVDAALASFRLPRWEDQPEYVELWCEKDALSSVLEPICDERHVTLMVNRGYSSSSAMYEASKRIENRKEGRDAHIIYLGDFDPSGEDMVRDIADRMVTFGVEVEVSKLALNPDQVKAYRLPHNPAKETDSRSPGFIAKHGRKSYEVDALPPEVLQKMVKAAIESHMNIKKYNATKTREDGLKRKLVKLAESI